MTMIANTTLSCCRCCLCVCARAGIWADRGSQLREASRPTQAHEPGGFSVL